MDATVRLMIKSLILVALISASSAFGQGSTLVIQSTSASVGVWMAESTVNFTFPTPTGVSSYDHIQAVFNAPAGYAFKFSGGEFHALICYGQPLNARADSLFESSSIDFVTGMDSSINCTGPTIEESNVGANRGDPSGLLNIGVDQGFVVSDSEFTSVTLQWQRNLDYELAPFSVGIFAGIFSIVPLPVPEPSVFGLLLMGVVSVHFRHMSVSKIPRRIRDRRGVYS